MCFINGGRDVNEVEGDAIKEGFFGRDDVKTVWFFFLHLQEFFCFLDLVGGSKAQGYF